jgi:hypothetical protein
MLVARAQLNFIRDLVARFERDDGAMRPVADYQSQYVAIIALLRSVGHVFEKVDCADAVRRAWNKAQWSTWKQEPIFGDFIEPTRNALLKEFQGGLQLRSGAFDPIAIVVDPAVPGGVSHVAGFKVLEVRDIMGRSVLPKFHAAIAFWDRCLKEAEAAFGETSAPSH